MGGMATPKTLVQKSEAWLSFIVVVGTLLATYAEHLKGAQLIIAIVTAVTLTGVFAFFNTPLASPDRPGIKTKEFWIAAGSIVASMCAGLSEVQIEGIPHRVTQTAGLLTAAFAALGYNIWRYKNKTALPVTGEPVK